MCNLLQSVRQFYVTAPKPKPEGIMPLIQRFHPNLEENVEEEYVEEEDKEENQGSSEETGNEIQSISNNTKEYVEGNRRVNK